MGGQGNGLFGLPCESHRPENVCFQGYILGNVCQVVHFQHDKSLVPAGQKTRHGALDHDGRGQDHFLISGTKGAVRMGNGHDPHLSVKVRKIQMEYGFPQVVDINGFLVDGQDLHIGCGAVAAPGQGCHIPTESHPCIAAVCGFNKFLVNVMDFGAEFPGLEKIIKGVRGFKPGQVQNAAVHGSQGDHGMPDRLAAGIGQVDGHIHLALGFCFFRGLDINIYTAVGAVKGQVDQSHGPLGQLCVPAFSGPDYQCGYVQIVARPVWINVNGNLFAPGRNINGQG